MGRPLRVLVVGRYFWPLGSYDSAGHLQDLATGLHRSGLHIEVATPKHAGGWTDGFEFREFKVHRPVRLFKTGWTARADRTPSRYINDLKQWTIKHASSMDIVLCDGAREESIAVADACRALRIPLVIRIAGRGQASDLEFFESGRMGLRCRNVAMSAAAVVLNNAADHRKWLSLTNNPDTARRIPIGIRSSLDLGEMERQQLRRALARINGDLHVPDGSTVLLSVERMRKHSGLNLIVSTAYELSSSHRDLQFWLIGDGPRRDSVYSRLRGDGLRHCVAMPGSFGLMDDAIVSSDLQVHSGAEGFEHQIPLAVACGVPLVVANSEAARSFFGVSAEQIKAATAQQRAARETDSSANSASSTEPVGELIYWFEQDDPKSLVRAVGRVIANRPNAVDRAKRLRGQLQRTYSQSDMIAAYVTMLTSLASASSRSQVSVRRAT